MSDYRQASLEALKEIVNEKQTVKFRWENNKDSVYVDILTAKLILDVYNSFDEEKKEKFENCIATSRVKFMRIVNLCWRS